MLFSSPSSATTESINTSYIDSVTTSTNHNAMETPGAPTEPIQPETLSRLGGDLVAKCDDINCNNELPASCDGKRPIEELARVARSENFDPTHLSNEEILELMLLNKVSVHKLESVLGKANAKRCVDIRRQYYSRLVKLLDDVESAICPPHTHQSQSKLSHSVEEDEDIKSLQQASSRKISRPPPKADVLVKSQNSDFDYSRVIGACCENVIGYVRLPVGIVGPLKLDGRDIYVPLATTEGCLVASTHRGLSALARSGGVMSRIIKNSMTRAPIVRFQDTELRDAINSRNQAMDWLQEPKNRQRMKIAFRSTSRHTNLIDYTLHPIGRELHIRFEAQTGDAMGMNMCSKGAEMALKEMQREFPTMDILTLSGNMCTDKKPSAVNWVNGRGKSVECNAVLPAEVVEKVFKVPVDSLIEVWSKKVMVGSALAGSVGGFNCHAANIVAAIFIATGQDAAQVVSSSNCIITMEKDSRDALAVHCSMPSIECGTVGGGTVLEDQSNYLQLMGIKGSTITPHQQQHTSASAGSSAPRQNVTACIENTSSQSGDNSLSSGGTNYSIQNDEFDSDSNACKLARIICSTVMAAELSLLASLTEGTLVKSHMTHNRSAQQCKVL